MEFGLEIRRSWEILNAHNFFLSEHHFPNLSHHFIIGCVLAVTMGAQFRISRRSWGNGGKMERKDSCEDKPPNFARILTADTWTLMLSQLADMAPPAVGNPTSTDKN